MIFFSFSVSNCVVHYIVRSGVQRKWFDPRFESNKFSLKKVGETSYLNKKTKRRSDIDLRRSFTVKYGLQVLSSEPLLVTTVP